MKNCFNDDFSIYVGIRKVRPNSTPGWMSIDGLFPVGLNLSGIKTHCDPILGLDQRCSIRVLTPPAVTNAIQIPRP